MLQNTAIAITEGVANLKVNKYIGTAIAIVIISEV